MTRVAKPPFFHIGYIRVLNFLNAILLVDICYISLNNGAIEMLKIKISIIVIDHQLK